MKESNEAVRIGVYLNQHLIDRSDATAQMQHISRSELIRDGLERYTNTFPKRIPLEQNNGSTKKTSKS